MSQDTWELFCPNCDSEQRVDPKRDTKIICTRCRTRLVVRSTTDAQGATSYFLEFA